MKQLTVFHLTNCPYCRNARKALAELTEATPEYGAIAVEWVEETQHPERVEGHDYYYVPTIYAGDRKLYEAHPGESYTECKEQVKAALDAVLGQAG